MSCEKDYSAITVKRPPLPPKPEIALSLAEEPYLTEIYLNLEIKNVELPQAYSITRNGGVILIDTLTTNDTTVIDTGLTPSTSYDYRAYRLVNGAKTDSVSLQAATMDTTGHDFTWETHTFGNMNSSVLLDVFINAENDIWTSGEVNVFDSTGNDTMLNAIHWDGQEWELKKIPAVTSYGTISNGPLTAVFAFSNSNVWAFSLAGSFAYWNGVSWQSEFVIERVGSIQKIWGNSSSNIYFVGTNGNITYHDGNSW